MRGELATMAAWHLWGRPTRERGASAVEFALVVPVLLLVVYGIIAFGFIFSQQIALNNAARDAARAGVVQALNGSPLKCSDIADQARQKANTVGLGSAQVEVTVSAVGSCSYGANVAITSNTAKPCALGVSGQKLTVSLRYVSKPPVPIPMLNPITLNSAGVFQCEYN